MGVAVIVPVFGRPIYRKLARQRALPSVQMQTLPAQEVIMARGRNPAEARNMGVAEASAEWLCFLDADDELDSGYLEAMMTGTADLRGPATLFVKPTGNEGPLLVPVRDLETEHNFLVIGTLVRREMFLDVGGFQNWQVHEDYDLWLRCHRAGASIEQIEAAVYVVHERRDSRNRKPLSYKRRVDAAIRRGEAPGGAL